MIIGKAQVARGHRGALQQVGDARGDNVYRRALLPVALPQRRDESRHHHAHCLCSLLAAKRRLIIIIIIIIIRLIITS